MTPVGDNLEAIKEEEDIAEVPASTSKEAFFEQSEPREMPRSVVNRLGHQSLSEAMADEDEVNEIEIALEDWKEGDLEGVPEEEEDEIEAEEEDENDEVDPVMPDNLLLHANDQVSVAQSFCRLAFSLFSSFYIWRLSFARLACQHRLTADCGPNSFASLSTCTCTHVQIEQIDVPLTPSPTPSYPGSPTTTRRPVSPSSLILSRVRNLVIAGQLEPLEELLSTTPNFFIDAILKAGWTALMYASYRGYPEIVQFCLKRGSDPNYHKGKHSLNI